MKVILRELQFQENKNKNQVSASLKFESIDWSSVRIIGAQLFQIEQHKY